MDRKWFLLVLGLVLLMGNGLPEPESRAGVMAPPWQVQDPIRYSNLTLFPVTTGRSHDTSGYITLDEGLRSGEVEVTELGTILRRRRHLPETSQVNTLALVNHSKKPLILLAGEIVTGGKQDRVIGKGRVVLPDSDPLPLDVFCVEPGRWHGASQAFSASGSMGQMAAPKVREKAQAEKDQQQVWNATADAREGVARAAGVAADRVYTSSSYAELEAAKPVQEKIDDATRLLERDYERALGGALRGKNVVGVVVAVNGEVVWADFFADRDLFQRYWPKLLRSYVVEALSVPVVEPRSLGTRAARTDAETFVAERAGKQVIETEPGEYRLVEIQHPRYALFELTSLVEKAEPLIHFNKLRKEVVRVKPIRPLQRER
jgi:hypothetical protein